MNLFEYEGKSLLTKHSISTPKSGLIKNLGCSAPMPYPFVLKAQVMTGGRGKAGGVKVCRNDADFKTHYDSIINMKIKGHQVHGLLAEELMQADKEYYISITQQGVPRPTLIFSTMGGMDIESVAKEDPAKIVKMEIDPFTGLKDYQKKYIASQMDVDAAEAFDFLEKLEKTFFEEHSLLTEINPLGVVGGKLAAMDCKFVIDNHSKPAQSVISAFEEGREGLFKYSKPEVEKTTVTYVPLSGDVGMISDGAGTGMLTLDLLTDAGLDVACFTELGGMTTEEVMYRALELTLLGHPEIKALIIVLIGGFNRMDNMARGITKFVSDNNVKIPILTRMCGTMEEEGLQIMKEAGLPTYYNLTQTINELKKTVKGE